MNHKLLLFKIFVYDSRNQDFLRLTDLLGNTTGILSIKSIIVTKKFKILKNKNISMKK